MRTLEEDTTKGSVCSFGCKGKGKSKGKGKGDRLNCDSRGHYSRECPYQPQGKAIDSKEDVATAAREGIPHGSAQEARNQESHKKKEKVTDIKVKYGVVENAFGKSTEKNLKEIGSWTRRRKSQGPSNQLDMRK